MECVPEKGWDEVERLIPAQVKTVKSILEDKYRIKIPQHSDGFIVRCLRLKDGKLDKAVKLIKSYHSIMSDFDEWDATLQPSLFDDYYRVGTITPLLQRDPQGRRIFYIRTEMWDPNVMSFDEAVAGIWIMSQYVNAEYAEAQRHGFVTIWDFSNFSLQQAWAVKQWRLLSLVKWIQNGICGRVKAFHAIFHPRVIGVIYAGIKPFLKEKLRKRIIFHGDDLGSLHKYIDPKALPKKLGGTLDPDGDECIDRPFVKDLIGKDEYFKDMLLSGIPSK